MASSLDGLGLAAPRISLAAIGGPATTSDEWYNRLTPARKQGRLTVVRKQNRLAFAQPQRSIAAVFESRFDELPTEAASSRVELAALLKKAQARGGAEPEAIQPGVAVEQPASIQLAYADPSPTVASDAFSAISTVAPSEDETGAMADAQADLPLLVPLPVIRPDGGLVEEQEPEIKRSTGARQEKKLALAKPDSPVEKQPDRQGWSLRNLFGGARAGNGVAVYDIGAAKVYMPDGSILEAHSGVGKMADNPRYVHVKMNGPTPPHTYNLKLRERRFHGVEAIRMLPVDGKNKHGRDGFLTHSYLLRGRAAQSHGCVAFKDYDKFLKAFKNGKIKQLVVVSGGGKAVARTAQKGRDT